MIRVLKPLNLAILDLHGTYIYIYIILKGCPNQCSGKGRCLVDTCECLDGWGGPDCSIGTCGTCVHGECVSGFCKCDVGWDGTECDTESTCTAVNNCTDAAHGTCDKMDKCLCVDGFTGNVCIIL